MKKIATLLFGVAILATGATTVQSFSAKDLNGKTLTLDSLMGSKLTIISFWSTSCGPCKEERVLLDSLYKIYKDSGLSVIAVNIDSKKTLAQVAPMVKSYGWKFKVLVDPDANVMRQFKVSPIPHSFYIKPDKTLLKSVIGYTKKDAATIGETIRKAVHGNYQTS
jgi:thiol-disulfide isomerase/thioredoxin